MQAIEIDPETTPETTPADSYQKFEALAFGYAMESGPYQSTWPGLCFDPRGAAKLSCIAGWLVGIKMTDPELAHRLAAQLDDKLSYLASYGGDMDIEVDGGKQTVTVPRFRVVLGDDGTFGGFGIGWFRAITTEQLRAKAREDAGPEYDWRDIDKTKEQLGVRSELEQTRHYYTEADQKRRQEYIEKHHEHAEDDFMLSCEKCDVPRYSLGTSTEFVSYGYDFNGGLLMHGTGQEVFAVDISTETGPRWSIHT